jgi:hypothetical protein
MQLPCLQASPSSPQSFAGVASLPQRPQFYRILIANFPERFGVVHLFAMSELVHHDHLDHALRQPLPMSVTQDKLYDFAGIEITANKFSVVRELLKSLDKDHVGFHERVHIAATRFRICSATVEEEPGSVRMKLMCAFGRCVRSFRRSKPRGMVGERACVVVLLLLLVLVVL